MKKNKPVIILSHTIIGDENHLKIVNPTMEMKEVIIKDLAEGQSENFVKFLKKKITEFLLVEDTNTGKKLFLGIKMKKDL